jgi:arabinofuranan 3-O-arabinosyltransferase
MSVIRFFSEASWLSPERVRRIAGLFAAAVLLLLVADVWMHTRAGLADAEGIPLGRDFINYWSGAKLASSGHALQVYDIDGFAAFQRAHVAANATLKWYSYPPVMLLLSLPLALTGFGAGAALWLLLGYGLNAALLAPGLGWRWAALAAFAAPASLMNAMSGQNGAFSAALFAGGIALLDRRPWLAGALFGALCFKPHLGVLVPLALAAGGYGRAFAGAALSALVLCGICVLFFGPGIWPAFLHNAPINVTILETGAGFWPRMPTPFAAVMQAGGAPRTAYGAQILSAIAAAAITGMVWRSTAPLRVKGAVLILATFLTTPYAWDYDLLAVTFAVAWLVGEAPEYGFMSFEKFALALAIALPLITMPFLALAHLQPGFAFLWGALIVAARRAFQTRTAGLGAVAAAC